MSNWDGNGRGDGPVFPFWKVMLVGLLVLGATWLLGLFFFPESAP